MKPRRIYYRKKNKTIAIEGKSNNKSIFIWTLPSPEKLLSLLFENASIFPTEKKEKIKEKIKRLDIKSKPTRNNKTNLPIIKINRNLHKDAFMVKEDSNGGC